MKYEMQVEIIIMIVLRSVHTTPQLRCVAALPTYSMLLHYGVARKLTWLSRPQVHWNLKCGDAAVTCGRDVIDFRYRNAFAV